MEARELEQIYVAWGLERDEASALAKQGAASPNVARVLFQLAAWDLVIDGRTVEGEPAWIEGWMRWARSRDEPQQGTAAVIERILASGAAAEDLAAVVRAMQVDLLVNLCGLLDCEGLRRYDEAAPNHPTSGWRLVEIDSDHNALEPIECLQEGIEDFDPLNPDGVRRRA
jgi:hypothetical protein